MMPVLPVVFLFVAVYAAKTKDYNVSQYDLAELAELTRATIKVCDDKAIEDVMYPFLFGCFYQQSFFSHHKQGSLTQFKMCCHLKKNCPEKDEMCLPKFCECIDMVNYGQLQDIEDMCWSTHLETCRNVHTAWQLNRVELLASTSFISIHGRNVAFSRTGTVFYFIAIFLCCSLTAFLMFRGITACSLRYGSSQNSLPPQNMNSLPPQNVNPQLNVIQIPYQWGYPMPENSALQPETTQLEPSSMAPMSYADQSEMASVADPGV